MEVRFSSKALIHLSYWKKTGSTAIQKKISQLIEAIKKIRMKESENRNL